MVLVLNFDKNCASIIFIFITKTKKQKQDQQNTKEGGGRRNPIPFHLVSCSPNQVYVFPGVERNGNLAGKAKDATT